MLNSPRFTALMFLLVGLFLCEQSAVIAADQPYFHIQVVDDVTGRGVPLVELETVNAIVQVTDSAGNIAFSEPGLMNQTVFFSVRSHGYEFPKDGFGYRGARLEVTPGGKATLKIKRINLAERLYRITGAGIYRDSSLLGQATPISEPLLNAKVVGSDSVVNAVLNGRLHWFWGDTLRPSYPLGNFEVPGAVSELPGDGGLDPAVGVNLEYFKGPDGFAKPTCRMPGKGPTWIFGAAVIKNAEGQDELQTGYMKVEPPLKVYARGVARFHPQKAEFEQVVEFPKLPILFPEGQALTHRDAGVDYVYFCKPYPLVRIPATAAAFRDPGQYEAYTCLQPGSTVEEMQIDRTDAGKIVYGWKRNTAFVGPAEQQKLVALGKLKSDEVLLKLRDRDTGKPVVCHTGSVNWNAFRKRWVMITVQHYGTSLLGELWYAEADSPLGPWEYAVKIMTHEKYSFYNPKQHPYFDQQDGEVIYFEGTYTQMFSGNPVATPRYEYNQMMYRLDLADPRTALPVPVYQANGSAKFYLKTNRNSPLDESANSSLEQPIQEPEKKPVQASIQFLALDRAGVDTVPVFSISDKQGGMRLTTENPNQTDATGDQATDDKRLGDNVQSPLFYAVSAEQKSPSVTLVPLFEWIHDDGMQRQYRIGIQQPSAGFKRVEKPVCFVWKP